jgi:DNA repair exonuclease SbcCD ATPase subunit
VNVKSIMLEGFRSFKNQCAWTLPTDPGLYLVSGENRLDPQLGGNAAGKSSLWDAVVWGFYGKSARGLPSTQLLTWGRRHAKVEIGFERNGATRHVVRTINPNGITLDGKPTDQETLTKALGINYECFLFSAVQGQFNRYFFDLGPTDKLNLFSFVMDLDSWIKRSEAARRLQQDRQTELSDVQRSISRSQGRLTEITERLIPMDEAARQWDRQRGEKLEAAGERFGKVHAVLAGLERKRERAEGRLTLAENDVERLRDKSERLVDERGEAARRADKLEFSYRERKKAVARLKDDLVRTRKTTSVCPTCRQALSAELVKTRIKELRQDIEETTAARDHKLEAYRRAREDEEEAIARLKAIQDKRTSLQQRLEGWRRDFNITVDDIKRARRELDAVETEIKDLESGSNPYQEQYDAMVEGLHEIHEAILQGEGRQRIIEVQEADAAAWVKGFKELRLWLIDEVLKELEIETNNALTDMGLDGWEVQYEIERETKAHTISRGFSVNILPPGRKEPVKWDCYCGGETQRLRIAGSIGVANLIARRRGVELGFEVWDEPTQHINPGGVDDLLQFFRQRASVEGKQVYFVDHHVVDAGVFDGVYCVVRDRAGSRVVAGV